MVRTHPFKAVVAMTPDRVIGRGLEIPWKLPEDLRWFKRLTMGATLIMGSRTYESIGRPLPGRVTAVMSQRGRTFPGTTTIAGLQELDKERFPEPWFLCGGQQIYEVGLPQVGEVFLSLVHQQVEGDVFFPPFESEFHEPELLEQHDGFDILHYRRR